MTLTHTRGDTLKQQQRLLTILKKMSPMPHENKLPPQETWTSTRQLAEASNIGIYRTRYLLLGMVKKKKILVTERAVNHSLRWFPTKFPD